MTVQPEIRERAGSAASRRAPTADDTLSAETVDSATAGAAGGEPGFVRTHWLPATLLVALTLLLYGQGWTTSRGAYGDSFHHLINGVFVYDALGDPVAAISDPWGFATHYYRHYPAVNLGYYPPVFAIFEALLMSVFGVSSATGQLAVLLMAVALAMVSFAWCSLRFPVWWAAGTAAVLVSTPLLVFWGRDIMLKVPTLALVIGSMWGFERMLRDDHPSWSSVLIWAGCATAALWTKQHALFLVGVFGLSMLFSGRLRHLLKPRVVVGALLVLVATVGITFMTLRMGGQAVAETIGASKKAVINRFNWSQWMFYFRALPQILTWPTLLLAMLGLAAAWRRRETYMAPLLSWIVVFYVMHSFFKGQVARYGCLWIPPFVVLASVGLRSLRWHFRLPRLGHWRSRTVSVGSVALMAWLGATFAHASSVERPHVSSAYQRVAHDLCERLAPFSCLTFFPDRGGRLAACYRLAVEDMRGHDRDIYSFGRIVRGMQVLRNWQQRWPDLEAADASLRNWNVKYLLTEHPPAIGRSLREGALAEAIDGILANGAFREIRRYPVHTYRMVPERTLVLYERISPMTFDPAAAPPLHISRIRITIGNPARKTASKGSGPKKPLIRAATVRERTDEAAP